jgi:hypothetical protein
MEGTFATEVKSARRSAVAAERAAAPAAEAPTAASSKVEPPPAPAAGTKEAAQADTADFFKLPSGEAPINPEAKTAVEPAAPKVEPTAEVKQAAAEAVKAQPIKIGNRTFDKVEDAVEYAKELERARSEDQAYIEGVKDASKQAAKPPEEAKKSPAEQFAEDVFVDPVKAAKAYSEAIKEELRQEYLQGRQQEAVQITRQQQEAQAWDKFYQANTDLSEPDTRDLIQGYLVKKHWDEIKDLAPDEGFNKLAEYSRKALRISKQAALPTTVMPAGPVTPTGNGDAVPVAPTPAVQQEKVDFVSQVNNLRRRKK